MCLQVTGTALTDTYAHLTEYVQNVWAQSGWLSVALFTCTEDSSFFFFLFTWLPTLPTTQSIPRYSVGACVLQWPGQLYQWEHELLVGTPMLNRSKGRRRTNLDHLSPALRRWDRAIISKVKKKIQLLQKHRWQTQSTLVGSCRCKVQIQRNWLFKFPVLCYFKLRNHINFIAAAAVYFTRIKKKILHENKRI